MLRVGLTGGTGAGKSTVSARLAELGAAVVDADQIAREIVAPGAPALARIRQRFGAGVIGSDGSLDRAEVARMVFADDAARADLEAIMHPLIAQRTEELFAQAKADGARVVVHDVPLLVEKQLQDNYDIVLVVHADAGQRIARLARTRGMSPDEARQRIDAQATDEQRRAVADVWIDNSGTPAQTMAKVDEIWRNHLVPFSKSLEQA
ncbi:MAG: dephospho-CoA kinase [Micrococcales bacterium]|nr:MAG: dephospho-CoA kinase [Micrococcales bacterium]PIE27769.1 MAG: dephospho-CoA kinase [Micrococcales bacterium]